MLYLWGPSGVGWFPVPPSWLISLLKWLKWQTVTWSSTVAVHSGEISWEQVIKNHPEQFQFYSPLPMIPGVSIVLRPVLMLISQCVVLTHYRKHKLRPRANVSSELQLEFLWGIFFSFVQNPIEKGQASSPHLSEPGMWAVRSESVGFNKALGRCRGRSFLSPGKHRPHPRTPASHRQNVSHSSSVGTATPAPTCCSGRQNSLSELHLGALVSAAVVVVFCATFLCVYR